MQVEIVCLGEIYFLYVAGTWFPLANIQLIDTEAGEQENDVTITVLQGTEAIDYNFTDPELVAAVREFLSNKVAQPWG